MILMYHKVDIITPTIWWVTAEDLDRHLTLLKHKQFVYLDDYAAPGHQAVITFDDAYENVFHHALPVLRAHGVPFEVFVMGDAIGGWNDFDRREPPTRHMGLEHLEEVTRCRGRLQWHTASHPHLPKLDAAAIEREMTVPAHLREQFAAPHFTWFSYPGGAHDARAVEIARRNFSGAVSVIDGEPQDRWQMNRITVDRHTYFPARGIEDALRMLPRRAAAAAK